MKRGPIGFPAATLQRAGRAALAAAALWFAAAGPGFAAESPAGSPGSGGVAATLASLPAWRGETPQRGDWLLDGSPFRAGAFRTATAGELILSNGLIARRFRLAPNAATVALDNLATGEALLRGVKPEAIVEIDGRRWEIGGLKGQPNYAFLRPEWIGQLRADPAAFRLVGFAVDKPKERFAWKRVRRHAPDVAWPPRGVALRMDFAPPGEAATPAAGLGNLRVSVHYEMYDGVPCYCKWLAVHNGGGSGARAVCVERFSSEVLAAVERASEVDELIAGRIPPNMHVETDMAFGGMTAAGANRRSFRWLADPDFATQVNYERKTPCLLDVGPDLGPAAVVAPGGTFESFRAWVLPFDSSDRERCGLSMRRLYRTIAPWVTENPVMMHVRFADRKTVTAAIDQCAEMGFEMVILTFGSGFDLENRTPQTLALAKEYSEYARRKGIEIGAYSLLASRSVGGGNDVVMPPGQSPTFGASPCLGSAWGQAYFQRLDEFYRQSGFTLLEHDGSYPGDPCESVKHPGHRGGPDSRWRQWRTISDFYKWCRGEGIFLNVPDHYFLSGSSKTGMGYRETNWSLPREQQVIHTRQNIFDGTWEKTPSMGWMFVPLTEYQGGGDAATIEPLDAHLDHYQRMLVGNLALGVQACYRGPRLYDTPRTAAMVRRQVAWFKAHRDILESDLIHGRRADGRDVDWMLHVNPRLKEKGLLVAFNPTDRPLQRTLRANLYYTGLADTAQVSHEGAAPQAFRLARDYTIEIPANVPAGGMSWWTFE